MVNFKKLRFTTYYLISALLISGCSSISSNLNSIIGDDTFPNFPDPQVTTYILDLSASTNSISQLTALNSGIEEFISGKAFGDPFSKPQLPPLSLSMQFITLKSGSAPRFPLVSAETSKELYNFLLKNQTNLDQAIPLWNGFIRARTNVYDSKLYLDSNCIDLVVSQFGPQALSKIVLTGPAAIICRDAKKTSTNLDYLNKFQSETKLPMGSDVFGAIQIAIKNMKKASDQYGDIEITIAIASDLVDEDPKKDFIQRIQGKNQDACKLGEEFSKNDFGSDSPLRGYNFILVGVGNTTYDFIEKNQKFWNCYFTSAGADVEEVSDLAGY